MRALSANCSACSVPGDSLVGQCSGTLCWTGFDALLAAAAACEDMCHAGSICTSSSWGAAVNCTCLTDHRLSDGKCCLSDYCSNVCHSCIHQTPTCAHPMQPVRGTPTAHSTAPTLHASVTLGSSRSWALALQVLPVTLPLVLTAVCSCHIDSADSNIHSHHNTTRCSIRRPWGNPR